MSAFFIFIGCLLLVAVLVWLIFRGADNTLAAMSDTPTITPADWQRVAEDFPSVLPPEVYQPQKPQPVPTVQIRLLSEKGNVIGATKIAAKARKQQMTFTTGKATKGVFQASQMDGGIWVYQRVSIEK